MRKDVVLPKRARFVATVLCAGAVALGLLVAGCGGDSSSHPSTVTPVTKHKNGLWVANSGGPNVPRCLSNFRKPTSSLVTEKAAPQTR
jgi:hypothetical protein